MKSRLLKVITIILSMMVFVSVLTGCSTKKETIKIATKPMTEQFILGEMLALLIEDNTDLEVQMTKGVGGGTSNIHPAMVSGEFDIYPEYTGTSWREVLKKKDLPDTDTLYKELTKEYEEKYNLEWGSMYGFNNTYGLAIREDLAQKYNMKTYSDLAKYVDKFVFGAEYDFYEREDGYEALCDTYGLKFKKTVDMDIGLKYNAIKSKEIDVMNVFTTDGQLTSSNVVLLEDDKEFYETYYCGTVIRKEVLDEHPELKDVLTKMENVLTESEMAKLNYKVETESMDEKEVAKEFLQSKGLLE